MPETIPVHAAIAMALKDLGVETLFGLMGDANLFMVDRFVREGAGRYVPAVHEGGAVLMALGWGAMTGRVAAATITQGPALSNATTALIEGVKGTIPMVLLCGDTPAGDPDHQQAVAQRALVASTGAGYVPLRSPETVVEDVAAAFRKAWAERRPVVLNMPAELMWEPVNYHPPVLRAPAPPVAPTEGGGLDDAVGIIAAARAPLILAGRGAVGARDALLALATCIGAPVATTLKASGLFAGAPHDLGVFGTLSTPAASEVIAASDCIVAFGAGLNRFTTVKGGLLEGKRLVRIDDDARQLDHRHAADAALTGDAAAVADTLRHWLDEAEIPSSRATDRIDADALRAPLPMPKATNRDGTVDLTEAMVRLDAAMPQNRVFVSDGGRFMGTAWSRVGVSGPQNLLVSINVGAIGMGTGYAIGAAVARPDQRVLFVTGDGGFMMGGLAEYASALREGLDMVTVVCNDNAYGAEYVQFEDRQMDPGLSVFDWPSFAGMARAMGGRAVRVTSQAGLADAEAAIGAGGPVLIELMLDPAAIPRLQL